MTHQRTAFAARKTANIGAASQGMKGRLRRTTSSAAPSSTAVCSSTIQRNCGASKVEEPKFRWMVLLHTAVLLGAALEVVLLRRPFILWLAAPLFAVFLAANAVRWWVIRSLGEHWNVQVMDSTRLGVVTSGPFRYVRSEERRVGKE